VFYTENNDVHIKKSEINKIPPILNKSIAPIIKATISEKYTKLFAYIKKLFLELFIMYRAFWT